MARRPPLIARGSILTPKAEESPDAPADMMERVLQRNRDRNQREAPAQGLPVAPLARVEPDPDEKREPAKSEEYYRITVLPVSHITRNIFELGQAILKVMTCKLPDALNDAVDIWLRDHWKVAHKKQDIMRRGVMLALYELQSGQKLMDFGDGYEPRPDLAEGSATAPPCLEPGNS